MEVTTAVSFIHTLITSQELCQVPIQSRRLSLPPDLICKEGGAAPLPMGCTSALAQARTPAVKSRNSKMLP